MPSIYEMHKNYIIESENDIPQKYREEIERRLNLEKAIEHPETPSVISGKRGEVISQESELSEIFSSNQDFYFGHGTTGGENVITSILENGLMTVNPEAIKAYGNTLRGLDSTSISFGEGNSSLFSSQKDLLENWPHKESKDVVIVAISQKYILELTDVRYSDLYGAFYTGSAEEGYKLRPEFIKGIYNADSHSFTPNDNFYQNLEPEQQSNLFEDIKQQYIKLFAENSFVTPSEAKDHLPLDENELEQLEIAWYTEQLKKLRKDKSFETRIIEDVKVSDFNDAVRSIRECVQEELEEDREETNGNWILNDWE